MKFDVAVIGAGHAGCEAALASARLGMKTALFTIEEESIAMMPCNPNVGGTSKGHLVREIDAMGGEMGKVIDRAFIQSKMLNRSKGPAVHSLRAQADKKDYHNEMMKSLDAQENLEVFIDEVKSIKWESLEDTAVSDNGEAFGNEVDSDKLGAADADDLAYVSGGSKRITGITTVKGLDIDCKAVVLCTGTYLKARCIYGEVCNETGPKGLERANYLSDSLKDMGIKLRRYKTGTPARISEKSIDFSKMEEQFGDEWITPFSFTTDPETIQKDQVSCFLTYTCDEAHEIIRQNIHRSPLFSGVIEGTGPRYCPSIEDKVVKFPDKKRHQIFLEPEGLDTDLWYVAGMSSSLPADVQEAVYRLVPGLENCEFVKYAYAIEYDCIDARLLRASLEFKDIKGLYSAGQFNGSSGYEEAAAQGLMAGINAALKIRGDEPLVLDRSEGYIGVLIDDLVTKESHEPYRMMTSRAEYRLLLRQDNADQRITPIGHKIGLIDEERYNKLLEKERMIDEEIQRLEEKTVGTRDEVQTLLEKLGSTLLKSGSTMGELLRRPEISYKDLAPIDTDRKPLPYDVIEEVEINLKYQGYIDRQNRQVAQFKKMEGKLLPDTLDYTMIHNLRTEAVQKLSALRPANIGQASRISGVSPSDISVLLIYLEQMKGRK